MLSGGMQTSCVVAAICFAVLCCGCRCLACMLPKPDAKQRSGIYSNIHQHATCGRHHCTADHGNDTQLSCPPWPLHACKKLDFSMLRPCAEIKQQACLRLAHCAAGSTTTVLRHHAADDLCVPVWGGRNTIIPECCPPGLCEQCRWHLP